MCLEPLKQHTMHAINGDGPSSHVHAMPYHVADVSHLEQTRGMRFAGPIGQTRDCESGPPVFWIIQLVPVSLVLCDGA